MAIPKIPIYRFLANIEAEEYSYAVGAVPDGAVSIVVVGFSGQMPFVPGGPILEPDELEGLTLWMVVDDASIDDGVLDWQPRVGTPYDPAGTTVDWNTNSGNDFQMVNDVQYVNQGTGAYAITTGQGRTEFINTHEWHIFVVGVFTQYPTADFPDSQMWNNHKLLGDSDSYWGGYTRVMTR